MRSSRAAFTMPSMSFGCTGTFVPTSAVPALPGAMNTSPTAGDCASFHAIACSRPPFPTRSTRALMGLLPLDGARWLGRDVVDHAVHPVHLVHDPVRDPGEQFVRQPRPVGRH